MINSFPKGTSRSFWLFMSFFFFFLREQYSVFEVVALVRPSASTVLVVFVILDICCSSRGFLIRNQWRPAILTQRIFKGICLSAALFCKWPSKSTCKWVSRCLVFVCVCVCCSTDTTGVVFDTRSKMVMWQGGTTERMKEKVGHLTWRALLACKCAAQNHKFCAVSGGF